MIRSLFIAALLAAPAAAADTPAAETPAAEIPAKDAPPAGADDLLRFTNGNQIDGRFAGMDPSGTITWTRPDVASPMPFQRKKVRQIVLRQGKPLSPMTDPCHVTLVNGDRIPGKVIAADEKNCTLETTAAGTLTIPRDAVAVIAPNPFGGRLLYAGPFDEAGWKIIRSDAPAFEGDPFANNPGGQPLPKEKDEDGEDKPSWVHSGASWYCRGGQDALTLDAGMTDRSLLRFKLGWRSRPNIAVAFHADLERPEPPEKEEKDEKDAQRPKFGGMQNLARLFGSAYVLNFQSGYVHLQRTGFDKEGNPEVERVRVGSTSVRLDDTGEAIFEIRCDRREGTIAVHVDGEFAIQWSTADDGADAGARLKSYGAPGSGLGFQVQGNSSDIRVSDVVVAEWNGMTDSARSMESETRDIVLLTNGTDRFSGKVLGIAEGQLTVEASYAPLKIPLDEIAEIHFARENRRKPSEAPAAEITVHLQPIGRISGIPLSSADGRIQLDTRLAGKVDLDLSAAVVLEFQSAGGFLDAWDDAP